MSEAARADRWRQLMLPATRAVAESMDSPGGALESMETGGADGAPPSDGTQEAPADRIARAKEAMRRLIKDRYGDDPALRKSVDEMVISSEDAIEVLKDADKLPSDDQFAALEAIVAFDGTRPSFLVKEQEVDFTSSFNTATWDADLQPYLATLARHISCVGRVEQGVTHIGTAFLVTPTLAITNRHVAQSIAGFGDNLMQIKANIALDFGREEWDGRTSYDRRTVDAVVFAGKDPIVLTALDHRKLDLAILRVSASKLAGNDGQRCLPLSGITRAAFGASTYVATIGYPGGAERYVPAKLQSKYEEVLARLLEGDGGAKRFAPGKPMATDGVAGIADWTVMHDATTINGNSGSPVVQFDNPPGAPVVGLHYGGDWGGERSNWAHLLKSVGGATGYGGTTTFAQFCAAEGIAI